MPRIRIPPRPPGPPAGKKPAERLLAGLAVLIALTGALVWILAGPFPPDSLPEGPAGRTPPGGRPRPEAAPGPPARGARDASPRMVILFDDIGQDPRAARELLDMDLPLSFAVLPHLPHSRQIALEAKVRGREILLHLPLEPLNYPAQDPGPGGLLLAQSPEEWRRLTRRALDAVPGISGVNNHMGSRFTERLDAMEIILGEIRARGLYFVDSYTSPRSVAGEVSRRLGLRTTRRTVFLDNERDEEKILARIGRLVADAKKNGSAFGIGHPHRETIAALRRALPMIRASGVRIVPPSALVR